MILFAVAVLHREPVLHIVELMILPPVVFGCVSLVRLLYHMEMSESLKNSLSLSILFEFLLNKSFVTHRCV